LDARRGQGGRPVSEKKRSDIKAKGLGVIPEPLRKRVAKELNKVVKAAR
jgi:hypothetical protein